MFQTTNQLLKVVYPFIKLTIKPAIQPVDIMKSVPSKVDTARWKSHIV